MTPVLQRRQGFGVGQCTEAAVASLLDVTLDEVPDLYDPEKPLGERQERFDALMAWLRGRGLMWCQVHFPRRATLDELPVWILRLPDDLFRLFDGYHLIGGNVEHDGLGHMVVGQRGRVAWDPNPGKCGVVEVDDVIALVPIESLPQEWRGAEGLQWNLTEVA